MCIQDKMTIGHEAYDEKKIKEASMNIIKLRREPNEDVNKDIKLILREKKQGRKTNNQDVDNNNDTRLLMRTKWNRRKTKNVPYEYIYVGTTCRVVFCCTVLQTLVQNTWPLDNKIQLKICIINERTRRTE